MLNGSRILDAEAGIDAQITKHLMVTATGGVQSVAFDRGPTQDFLLQGGHTEGGTISVRETINPRTSLTADYDVRFATVAETDTGGTATFTIQNSWAGAERRISSSLRAFGAFGVSRMGATEISPARTGPAWRAGVSEEFQKVGFDASYVRSYIPSFSFGGTQQNEALNGVVRLSLARRLSTQGSTSWQRNEPLTPDDLRLKSLWFNVQVGYALRPWIRIGAFYEHMHQTIDRPGGLLDLQRLGVQVITTKPMRIR